MADILEIWLRSLFSRHYTTHNQSYRVIIQKLMYIMTSSRQKKLYNAKILSTINHISNISK